MDRAFAESRKFLQSEHGITGEQLALLRIVGEQERWPLAVLRGRLSMHPATLGQILARLEQQDLVVIDADPADKRRRLVAISQKGIDLCREIPLIGPVRLRSQEASAEQLESLAAAFDAAVGLFGLDRFAPNPDATNDKEHP